MERRALTEIGVCALVAVACAVFFLQASILPPGTFEPLGSGPVPMVTAAIVMVCCLIVIVSAALHIRRGEGIAAQAQREFTGASPAGPLVTLGATVLYIFALDQKLASFGLLSFVFLAFLIIALQGIRVRVVVPAVIVAAVFAFGVEYVFTQVFVVDLPA